MKCSEAEGELRVAKVFEMVTNGASYNTIIRYCGETWGIGDTQSDNYLKRARDKIKQIVEAQYPTVLQEAVQLYDNIIENTMYGPKKDFITARSAIADKMKLLGFMQTRVQVTTDIPKEEAAKFRDWDATSLEQSLN